MAFSLSRALTCLDTGAQDYPNSPGDQKDGVPAILLPQRRRAAGDLVANQKSYSSTASSQEVKVRFYGSKLSPKP